MFTLCVQVFQTTTLHSNDQVKPATTCNQQHYDCSEKKLKLPPTPLGWHDCQCQGSSGSMTAAMVDPGPDLDPMTPDLWLRPACIAAQTDGRPGMLAGDPLRPVSITTEQQHLTKWAQFKGNKIQRLVKNFQVLIQTHCCNILPHHLRQFSRHMLQR